MTRVGDVGGFEIPSRFFRFLRGGDPRPLEAVLEHNRLDLVSLAAVMARAVDLARSGHEACRDCREALALGRIYERAAADDRVNARQWALTQAKAMLSTRVGVAKCRGQVRGALQTCAVAPARAAVRGSGGHLA